MVVSEPTGGCQAVASVCVSLGDPLITQLLDYRDATKGASTYAQRGWTTTSIRSPDAFTPTISSSGVKRDG
jgi:hypothetical protein